MSRDDWGHLQLPAPIPEFVVRPDRTQIFMFSAVTWNRHRIHYDKDAAIDEGLPDIVAQRGLIGNFFARLLTEWMGNNGEIRELRWKVKQSVLSDLALRCAGEVVTVETVEGVKYATCALRMQDESGREVATGEARVCLV
jgi:hydroxyacyl-ACP dehydratase HTD2-like protein with hotdog domain